MRLTGARYYLAHFMAVSYEDRRIALVASSCPHEEAESLQQPIHLQLTAIVLQLTGYPSLGSRQRQCSDGRLERQPMARNAAANTSNRCPMVRANPLQTAALDALPSPELFR